jgi:hypothetical protein
LEHFFKAINVKTVMGATAKQMIGFETGFSVQSVSGNGFSIIPRLSKNVAGYWHFASTRVDIPFLVGSFEHPMRLWF